MKKDEIRYWVDRRNNFYGAGSFKKVGYWRIELHRCGTDKSRSFDQHQQKISFGRLSEYSNAQGCDRRIYNKPKKTIVSGA